MESWLCRSDVIPTAIIIHTVRLSTGIDPVAAVEAIIEYIAN